jgi:S1-C subfamily serine protease
MGVIEELSELVRTASDAAGPSVVAIGRHGRGSGFVVAPGRVLTNAHNLRDETTLVRFGDGRAVQGAVVGSDVDGDLVVLDVDTGDVAPLAWADSPVAPGDTVVTVTAGRDQRRSAWGQVTATEAGFRGPRGRPIVGAIEHATPSGPGSSGAPVLDRTGRVVGVNTHRL